MRCPSCQRDNPVDGLYCGGCGRRLAQDVAARHDPRSHTPRHLVEQILTTRSALEGERKQVTVLFVDVKGSMELAQQLDLELWHRILDRFFRILGAGVAAFEGTINQFTGDGIMALFGAPLAHEDHAQRACHAALRLAGDMRVFAQELRAAHGLEFAVRIGLNSGEVVVGKIGDDLRMDYTAMGHTVGLAARLQEIAAPGQIVVSDQTAALVAGLFTTETIGARPVKGVKDVVRAHVLRGVGDLRTRLDVARMRGLTSFVGREVELAALEAALQRALEGHGAALGIVGAPGVGKSRLCQELVALCRSRDIRIVETHCLSHARHAALAVVRDLLRRALGVAGDADAAGARTQIAQRLLALDPTLGDVVGLIQDLMAVPDPGSRGLPADPVERERAVADALRRMLRAQGALGPLVVHLDDAHWIDPESQRVLGEVADVARTTRTLLLLTFRPDFHVGAMAPAYYQQLVVSPLGAQASAAMIANLLGGDPSVAGLAALIRERTEGNPFFVEELVRALDASRAVVGVRGAYCLTRDVAELGVPATVQSLLAARIDSLAEADKLVLQSAAVIGRRFSERVLAHVVELPPAQVVASLAILEGAEFVHRAVPGERDDGYAFQHPLTQEVAYASQLVERRIALHAAVARALEEVLSERLGEGAAVIAHHWEQAQQPSLAHRWRRLAALRVTRIQPRRSLSR
jgi:class 3 adenylate cyclase